MRNNPVVAMGFSFCGFDIRRKSMSDSRFKRLYVLKTKEGEIEKLKQICEDYEIETNEVCKNAASFHRAWGFTGCGLVYLSHTMFLYNKIDFNSLEELEKYRDQFLELN